MRNNNIFVTLALLALSLSSCSDQFDMKYVEEWSEETIWTNSTLAEAAVSDLYVDISHRPDSYGSNFLDVATDNAMSHYHGGSTAELALGGISTTNNPIENWSTCYNNIQHANLCIENCDSENLVYSFTSEDTHYGTKYHLLGESYFLRAYYCFMLLQVCGGKSDSGEALGYPIITEYTTNDVAEAMLGDYKRNTYEECIDQILEDLDTAIDYLSNPLASAIDQVGRANANAAYALKSRVALYGASPAYQPNSVTQITDMGQFVVVDEAAYETKWKEAASATYLSLNATQYVMYGLSSTDLADVSSTTPMEHLFRFYFSNRNLETLHFLPRYYGTAYTTPSQNLVDAFPMANGYPIWHADSGYDPTDPYAGREERFYLNIYYHGAEYGDSTYDSETSLLSTVNILPDGADAPESSMWSSQTGYYLAKFLSKNFNCNTPTGTSSSAHYWATLRRTELFLNYAEAANEAFGPTGVGSYTNKYGTEVDFSMSAYDAIKSVRQYSAGITGDDLYLEQMASSKESLRALIQNERRLELAFENQRFFDMRRWLLTLNEPVSGVEASYDVNGDVVYTTKEVEQRKYDGVKYYYLPLPYSEVVKGLENNMGW